MIKKQIDWNLSRHELSGRVLGPLSTAGILTVRDLLQIENRDKVSKIKNIGNGSMEELDKFLKDNRLKYGKFYEAKDAVVSTPDNASEDFLYQLRNTKEDIKLLIDREGLLLQRVFDLESKVGKIERGGWVKRLIRWFW